MEKRVLYIGGSPCSGKSTIAEQLAREYNAYYFKADDSLDELVAEAAKQHAGSCEKVSKMTADEIWMRDPAEQCREEFQIYKEISGLLFGKLKLLQEPLIVAEGAAFTPEVMEGVEAKNYLTMIPTPDFQISHYKERPWISFVLADCTEKEKAFANWMQRDILFAKQMEKECRQRDITCILTDGSRTAETTCDIVKNAFGLS